MIFSVAARQADLQIFTIQAGCMTGKYSVWLLDKQIFRHPGWQHGRQIFRNSGMQADFIAGRSSVFQAA